MSDSDLALHFEGGSQKTQFILRAAIRFNPKFMRTRAQGAFRVAHKGEKSHAAVVTKLKYSNKNDKALRILSGKNDEPVAGILRRC